METIQRLTSAEALANLKPYSDNNRNSTSYLFLDIEDDYKLKGIFFNDAIAGEKIIKVLSSGNTISNVLTFKALISQSGVNKPFLDTSLGVGGGEAFVDTLGGVFNYIGVGEYSYVKVGAFTDVKKVNIVLGENRANQNPQTGVAAYVLDDDTIKIDTSTWNQFNPPYILTKANDLLYVQPITIEVYN